jgi:5-methylcytosine-specific restriction endonuclease McrA
VTRPPWLADEPTPAAARPGATEVRDSVRQLVYRRAGDQCESCGTSVRYGRPRNLHHRRPRAMGGSRAREVHQPSNLLLLCPPCHVLVETHRTKARDAGLLVRQGADPRLVLVTLYDGQQHALDDEGGMEPPMRGAA